jgi:Glycosyl hydrolase family 20, catalytic domain
MDNWSRRKFLEAGIALGSVAASSRLCAESAGWFVPEGWSDPAKASDAQPMMRGLMVDAARLPESMEYYRRVVDFCAEWQLNTLQFRLADDQGSALRFQTVPDLLTHKNAFTPEEMSGLAAYAASRGVDLLPEIESFGHTGFITRSPAYAHLLDASAAGDAEFTGVIPVHPETLPLFEKLYREVAAIFPSRWLHGGCDEVNWGGSALSRHALQAKSRAQIWAEYLNALGKISVGLGKQFIVWGDFVLHKEPEILPQLDKNIVLMDWNYSENSSAKLQETLDKVRANGSRGIGAPGLINYRWGPRVGREQLRNIDAYSECYVAQDDPASLGVILTNWVPTRYLQNSIWDGFAYGAVAFNMGTATAQTSAWQRFVEKHYGAQWNEMWDEAFALIYDYAPYVKDRETASWMGLQLRVPWSNDEELRAVLADIMDRPNPYAELMHLLVSVEGSVSRNKPDFESFKLCVLYLGTVLARETAVVKPARVGVVDPKADRVLIENIAEQDRKMAEALEKDWDEGRPADSPAKLEPVFGFRPKDELLFQWRRAAAYSASLAADPERYFRLAVPTAGA